VFADASNRIAGYYVSPMQRLLVVTALLFWAPSTLGGSAKATYQVTIETVPPGATVHLSTEGQSAQGTTPFRVKALQGTHKLTFELEGYEPLTAELTIDKTAYKKAFTYTLKKAAAP
jgi:hypothetical protein